MGFVNRENFGNDVWKRGTGHIFIVIVIQIDRRGDILPLRQNGETVQRKAVVFEYFMQLHSGIVAHYFLQAGFHVRQKIDVIHIWNTS